MEPTGKGNRQMAKTLEQRRQENAKIDAEVERQMSEYRTARATPTPKPASTNAATPKQIEFITKLIARDPAYASNFLSSTDGLSKAQASRIIDTLLAGA